MPEAMTESAAISLAESQPQKAFNKALEAVKRDNQDPKNWNYCLSILGTIHRKLKEMPHGVSQEDIQTMCEYLIGVCTSSLPNETISTTLRILALYVDTDKQIRQLLVPSVDLFGANYINVDAHVNSPDMATRQAACLLAVRCLQRLPGIDPWMVSQDPNTMLTVLLTERTAGGGGSNASVEHRLNCLEATLDSHGGEIKADGSRMAPVEAQLEAQARQLEDISQSVKTLSQAVRLGEGAAKAHGTEIRTLEMAVQSHTASIKRLGGRDPVGSDDVDGRVAAVEAEVAAVAQAFRQAQKGTDDMLHRVDTLAARVDAPRPSGLSRVSTPIPIAPAPDVDGLTKRLHDLEDKVYSIEHTTRPGPGVVDPPPPIPAAIDRRIDDLDAKLEAAVVGMKPVASIAESAVQDLALFQSSTVATLDYLKSSARAQAEGLQQLKMMRQAGAAPGAISKQARGEIQDLKDAVQSTKAELSAVRDAVRSGEQAVAAKALESDSRANDHTKRSALVDIEMRRMRGMTESAAGAVAGMEGKLAVLEHRLAEVHTTLDGSNDRINRALAEVRAGAADITKADLAVKSLQASARSTSDRLAAHGVRLNEVEAAAQTAQATIHSVVSDVEQVARDTRMSETSLREQVGGALDRVTEARSAMMSITGRTEQLETRMASVEEGWRAVREAVHDGDARTDAAIEAHDGQLHRLDRTTATLDGRSQALEAQVTEMSTGLTQVTQTAKGVNARLGSQASDIETLLTNTQRLSDDVSRVSNTVAVHERLVHSTATSPVESRAKPSVEADVAQLAETVRGMETAMARAESRALSTLPGRAASRADGPDDLFNLTRGLPSRADVTEIRTQLDRLTKRVDEEEARLTATSIMADDGAAQAAATHGVVIGLARSLVKAADPEQDAEISVTQLITAPCPDPDQLVATAANAVASMARVLAVSNRRVDSLSTDVHDRAQDVTALQGTVNGLITGIDNLTDNVRSHADELARLSDTSRRHGATVAEAVTYQQTKQQQLVMDARQNLARLGQSDVSLAAKIDILRWTYSNLSFLPDDVYTAVLDQMSDLVSINKQFFAAHPQPAQDIQEVAFNILSSLYQLPVTPAAALRSVLSALAVLDVPTTFDAAIPDLPTRLADTALSTPDADLKAGALGCLSSVSRTPAPAQTVASHTALTQHLTEIVSRPADSPPVVVLEALRLLRVISKLPHAAAIMTQPHVMPRVVALLDSPDPATVEYALLLIKAVGQHGERAGESILRLDGVGKMVMLMSDQQKTVAHAATLALRSLAAASVTMQRHLAQVGVLEQLGLRYPAFGRGGSTNPSAPATPRTTVSTPYAHRRSGSAVGVGGAPTGQARVVRPTSTPLTVGVTRRDV